MESSILLSCFIFANCPNSQFKTSLCRVIWGHFPPGSVPFFVQLHIFCDIIENCNRNGKSTVVHRLLRSAERKKIVDTDKAAWLSRMGTGFFLFWRLFCWAVHNLRPEAVLVPGALPAFFLPPARWKAAGRRADFGTGRMRGCPPGRNHFTGGAYDGRRAHPPTEKG